MLLAHAIPASPGSFEPFDGVVSEPVSRALSGLLGISRLYSHQARAVRLAARGRDLVLCTPTASGKSLVFQVPVLECVLHGRGTALFIYPLKALERDQAESLKLLCGELGLPPGTVAVYDGDTPRSRRRRILERLPSILVTTPDMLHCSILPNHHKWEAFLSSLRFVVLDELHIYRGVFGSHVSLVMRRLQRLCAGRGHRPVVICSSATIANPGAFASRFFGRETFEVISESGAPRGERHFMVLQPQGAAHTLVVRLLVDALASSLRTIVFTRSRKSTELIYSWTVSSRPSLRSLLAPYRSGYTPEERREIERRLASGELLGVISTSALELGIDIGGLDVCILVGYPGSISSLWQRAGRVGRGLSPSLTVLVPMQDALDQYFAAHPVELFTRRPEEVTVDPENEYVLRSHLLCAACEHPLQGKPRWPFDSERGASLVRSLVDEGALVSSPAGALFPSSTVEPWKVDIRNTGEGYVIVEEESGRRIGTVSGVRAQRECHPGAVYLHGGVRYLVSGLDDGRRRILVRRTNVGWYTNVLSSKSTAIVALEELRVVGGALVCRGRLEVTERVVGYEKRRWNGGDLVEVLPLEGMSPRVFETHGLWVCVDPALERFLQENGAHHMGSMHACEHALISLFPLFVLCARDDVGGICYPRHPQLPCGAVFVYDGYEGGVGLTRAGYERLEELLQAVASLLEECGCESGCPSCIHSPKCGSGNKPLDKAGASLLVRSLLDGAPARRKRLEALGAEVRSSLESPVQGRAAHTSPPPAGPELRVTPESATGGELGGEESGGGLELPPDLRYVVFDIETVRGADEVGGWRNVHLMRMAVGVLYDGLEDEMVVCREEEVDEFIERLAAADVVVGFNVLRFDYRVLSAYTDMVLSDLPTFDILVDVQKRIGRRLKLAGLAASTLGRGKSADGLQSLRWVRQGRLDLVERYCIDDVELTRDLLLHGVEKGYVSYEDRRFGEVRVKVDWGRRLLETAGRL